MTPLISVAVNCDCVLGEGPLWHTDENRLYWLDIPAGGLYRHDPETGMTERLLHGVVVGGFTIQQDGSLLLMMERGVVKSWRNGQLIETCTSLSGQTGFRFNDAIADPAGRVFSGTMFVGHHRPFAVRVLARLRRLVGLPPPPGRVRNGALYRINVDGSINRALASIGRPNGMGFSPDHQHMYVTDSIQRQIDVFDYDISEGRLYNRRMFSRIPDHVGTPDGLTVDEEGGVWSAIMHGGLIVRFRSDGSEDRRIQLPVREITCLSFGGKNFREIYVTSAGGHRRDVAGAEAGAVFRVDAGIRGRAEFRSRIAVPHQADSPGLQPPLE